jgi:hypothetical protein
VPPSLLARYDELIECRTSAFAKGFGCRPLEGRRCVFGGRRNIERVLIVCDELDTEPLKRISNHGN